MKYQLTEDDNTQISMFTDHHPTGTLLKEYHGWKFEIDNILIRRLTRFNHNRLDLVSEQCMVPKKFRVVVIDKLGVPWVKQLSVRGGLGKRIICLAHDAGSWHYEIDPEQIEAILLGHRYDPREEYRRMRNENPGYGGDK